MPKVMERAFSTIHFISDENWCIFVRIINFVPKNVNGLF